MSNKPTICEGTVSRQGSSLAVLSWYATDCQNQGEWIKRLRKLYPEGTIQIAFDLAGQVQGAYGAIVYRITGFGPERLIAVVTL